VTSLGASTATLTRVKVAAVLKLIESDGWTLNRIRGSHRQYRHPTKPGLVTVPGKPRDDLHPNTLTGYAAPTVCTTA